MDSQKQIKSGSIKFLIVVCFPAAAAPVARAAERTPTGSCTGKTGAGFSVFGCEWQRLGGASDVLVTPAPDMLNLGETWMVSAHPAKTLVTKVASQGHWRSLTLESGEENISNVNGNMF